VLLTDPFKAGRERFEEAREAIALLCEPVEPPTGELEHIHFFCGNTEIPEDLQEREPRRVALYKGTAALVRAYANIADDGARPISDFGETGLV
jgi:type I restriction enzyme R subunit